MEASIDRIRQWESRTNRIVRLPTREANINPGGTPF